MADLTETSRMVQAFGEMNVSSLHSSAQGKCPHQLRSMQMELFTNRPDDTFYPRELPIELTGSKQTSICGSTRVNHCLPKEQKQTQQKWMSW
jgi:hypothetical protein